MAEHGHPQALTSTEVYRILAEQHGPEIAASMVLRLGTEAAAENIRSGPEVAPMAFDAADPQKLRQAFAERFGEEYADGHVASFYDAAREAGRDRPDRPEAAAAAESSPDPTPRPPGHAGAEAHLSRDYQELAQSHADVAREFGTPADQQNAHDSQIALGAAAVLAATPQRGQGDHVVPLGADHPVIRQHLREQDSAHGDGTYPMRPFEYSAPTRPEQQDQMSDYLRRQASDERKDDLEQASWANETPHNQLHRLQREENEALVASNMRHSGGSGDADANGQERAIAAGAADAYRGYMVDRNAAPEVSAAPADQSVERLPVEHAHGADSYRVERSDPRLEAQTEAAAAPRVERTEPQGSYQSYAVERMNVAETQGEMTDQRVERSISREESDAMREAAAQWREGEAAREANRDRDGQERGGAER